MTTGHPPLPQLATVRRFEAAGFRAWPAASVTYDGTWVVRLTPSYPAKRLNSVTPLDPGDVTRFAERIELARLRFDVCRQPLTFRLSPLAGAAISRHLDGEGWSRFDESLVMRLELKDADLSGVVDQIPLKDTGRFVGAVAKVKRLDPDLKNGLAGIVRAIRPPVGLFVIGERNAPVATAICVHDGDLAGLFEVATDEAQRGRGHGWRTVLSALKWARLRGAREAWLQVEASNVPAISLYRSIGFREIYRYHYRRPPGA
jgi:ribosomal protein S18 acetylase RimI-like enzyme